MSVPNAVDISDLKKTELSGPFDLKILYGHRGGKLEYEIIKKWMWMSF